MSQQHDSAFCQGPDPQDEYTEDRDYYKVNLGLTQIPDDIPMDARRVFLRLNNITRVPANAFSELAQCFFLQLDENPISEVQPGAFKGLTGLKLLGLNHVLIERLYVNMFSDLVHCTSLSMHSNQISEVEPGTFNGLINVENLFLNNNKLTALMAGIFQGLMAVEYITLYENMITFIEDNTFAGLKRLERISLNGNNLATLPENVFSHLPRPLELGLHDHVYRQTPDNPLQCDAALCWLKQGELQGTITWFYHDPHPDSPRKPECADGIDWDNWTCSATGKTEVVSGRNISPSYDVYVACYSLRRLMSRRPLNLRCPVQQPGQGRLS